MSNPFVCSPPVSPRPPSHDIFLGHFSQADWRRTHAYSLGENGSKNVVRRCTCKAERDNGQFIENFACTLLMTGEKTHIRFQRCCKNMVSIYFYLRNVDTVIDLTEGHKQHEKKPMAEERLEMNLNFLFWDCVGPWQYIMVRRVPA